ncbi:MAG: hypothetical protein KJ737_03915 [Proteobacteria bacterium]|nr:hypothetical protein [Pseudomonadota bacterium]
MKNIHSQITEFCTGCQKIQNLKGTVSIREEKTPDGVKVKIITTSYHCEICNAFIRSEEHDPENKLSTLEQKAYDEISDKASLYNL